MNAVAMPAPTTQLTNETVRALIESAGLGLKHLRLDLAAWLSCNATAFDAQGNPLRESITPDAEPCAQAMERDIAFIEAALKRCGVAS